MLNKNNSISNSLTTCMPKNSSTISIKLLSKTSMIDNNKLQKIKYQHIKLEYHNYLLHECTHFHTNLHALKSYTLFFITCYFLAVLPPNIKFQLLCLLKKHASYYQCQHLMQNLHFQLLLIFAQFLLEYSIYCTRSYC